MKKIFYVLIAFLTLISCEFDNREEPELKISGNFVCDGNVVPMRNAAVGLRFGQESYPSSGTFQVTADQSGRFTYILFPGEYQVTLPSDQGAYEANSEEVNLTVSENMEYNWEIVPFFLVSSVDYQKSGKSITVDAAVQKKGTKNIESVRLLVSGNAICDRVWFDEEYLATDISDLNNITIEADLSGWAKNYCFVRVAVKSEGNTYYNYSEVEKIEF